MTTSADSMALKSDNLEAHAVAKRLLDTGEQEAIAEALRKSSESAEMRNAKQALHWQDCRNEGPACELGKALKAMATRLDSIEKELAGRQAVLSSAKWVLPLVVGAASLATNLVSKLLEAAR